MRAKHKGHDQHSAILRVKQLSKTLMYLCTYVLMYVVSILKPLLTVHLGIPQPLCLPGPGLRGL